MNNPYKPVAMALCVLSATALSAQVSFGGKVGTNYFLGAQKIQPEQKDMPSNPKGLGLSFGGFAGIPFSDLVGVRPEIMFSFRKAMSDLTINRSYTNSAEVVQGGGTYTGTMDYTSETDQRLSYFQVNVPLTLSPSEGLRVMLGPSINFLMGGKQNTDETTTWKGTITNGNQQQSVDQQDLATSKKKGSSAIKDFKKADVMVMAGVGYTLPVGFDMDLRYYRGLSTTYDRTESNTRHRVWTNLIELAIGWQFGGE